MARPEGGSSRFSNLSQERPFVYGDNLNLAQVTQKTRFRELFSEHFEIARKATQGWKPNFESCVEKEGRKVTKFKDVAEFVDVKMQTAIRGTYDYDMSLDENMASYVR